MCSVPHEKPFRWDESEEKKITTSFTSTIDNQRVTATGGSSNGACRVDKTCETQLRGEARQVAEFHVAAGEKTCWSLSLYRIARQVNASRGRGGVRRGEERGECGGRGVKVVFGGMGDGKVERLKEMKIRVLARAWAWALSEAACRHVGRCGLGRRA